MSWGCVNKIIGGRRMSLESIDCYANKYGLDIVECSICKKRFSRNMIYAHPLCSIGLSHKITSMEE